MAVRCKLVFNNAWSDDGHVIAEGTKAEIDEIWFKWIKGDLTTEEKLLGKLHGPKLHMIEYKNDVRTSRMTTSILGLSWFQNRLLRNAEQVM